MHTQDLIFHVEAASLNAWPARRQAVQWGWLLRANQGYTRRANSVQPILQPPAGVRPPPLPQRIEGAEAFYGRMGQATIFKITPLVEPAELDWALAQRGYRRQAPTGVLIRALEEDAPLLQAGADALAQVQAEEELSMTWLRTFLAFSGTGDDAEQPLRAILEGIAARRGFLTLDEGDGPVALALAVQEDDLLGLFDVVVAPEARGKGRGGLLLRAALAWGAAQGAQLAYLQVMDDNQAARSLYAKLGFKRLYSYWYRVRQDPGAATPPPGPGPGRR